MTPPPPPVPDDDVHEWLSFDHEDETYTFDVTWLTSNWSCIYGAGCPGIGDRARRGGGARLLQLGRPLHRQGRSQARDGPRRRARARGVAAPCRRRGAGWADPQERGRRVGHQGRRRRVHLPQPARPSRRRRVRLPPGRAYGATRATCDWKPEVCWQVPMRLDYHRDDNDHLTYILREWKRRDWGEGGADFHWWCTEDPLAFVGHEPVYRSCADDIVGSGRRRALPPTGRVARPTRP